MNFQHQTQLLTQLGAFFKQEAALQPDYFTVAKTKNSWFTSEYVTMAFLAWANALTKENIDAWLTKYTQKLPISAKTVAIIMAGNIPLVGLHDLITVLVTGNKALVKLSSSDDVLMRNVIEAIKQLDANWATQITITDEQLPKNFDAVIATGSNNTNHYFEYYFKGKPALLRKSRTSVAIITGNETTADYELLGSDIFSYFGLGCRNVSKLYVPQGYNIATFYEGIEMYNQHINHHKYANNYTYHKAILLMDLTPHFDNNFLLLKQDENISSPLGVMFYEEYDNITALQQKLNGMAEQIQCIVSKQLPNTVEFGMAQYPALTDYADGVDTMKFLLDLG